MAAKKLENNKEKLKSDAIQLSDAFLLEAANSNQFNPVVVDLLTRARDAMWKGGTVERVAAEVIKLPDLEQRKQFMNGLIRLGQLYDLSALHTRERAIEESRQNVINNNANPVSGGVRDMLQEMNSYAEATEYLKKTVFEVVMTAHPTNVNDKENINKLRLLGESLHGDFVRNHEDRSISDATREAMRNLANDNHVVPEKAGLPTNITVSDEVDQVIYYLKNIYRNLPNVYYAFEESLEHKFRDSGEHLDPQALFLNMRYSSWGSSGDKDGNNKVTAETTLEAIIKHKIATVELYVEDLSKCSSGNPEMTEWQRKLTAARDSLHAILSDMKAKEKANLAQLNPEEKDKAQAGGFLKPEEFEAIKDQVVAVGLNQSAHKAFVAALDTAFKAAPSREAGRPFLELWRKAKTFDFNLARIEYRETAEEYERVVAALIPDYGDLCDEAKKAKKSGNTDLLESFERKKCDLLREKLDDKGFTEQIQAQLQEMAAAGYGKAYDKNNVNPIGYHTIKRMELARDFPEMITANVLAECQNASNILEAVLLQEMSKKNGNRAIMGVVPLFEEPDTMKRVTDIMQQAYDNPGYRQHMQLVADHLKSLGLSDGQRTQQVQIAHSDNTRRSGLPAARAFIYEAHDKIRKLNNQYSLKTEFFEGGSNSDPFRGGVRSISAATNMYRLHDFMKFTFQGGDNLGFFNYPGSITRLYARNLSHAAKYFRIKDKQQQGVTHMQRAGKLDSDDMPPQDVKGISDIALRVLKGTLEDYQQNVFHIDRMGHFLWITRDDYGNISSRAGARKAMDPTKEAIDPDEGMRTITFSESFQHAGIVPTWIGALTIEQGLRKELEQLGETQLHEVPPGLSKKMHVIELEGVEVGIPKDPDARLDPMVYRQFYKHSSVFRDVIDRMAFGLAMTDLDHITDYYPALKNDKFLQERLKTEYREAVSLVTAALPARETSLDKFKRFHIAPGSIASGMDSRGDRDIEYRCQLRNNDYREIKSGQLSFITLRDRVRDRLPHLKETMRDKSGLMRISQLIKRAWRQDWDENGRPTQEARENPSALGALHQWAMSLAHAAIDCVTHGRMMLADDPIVMRMFYPEHYKLMQEQSAGNGKNGVARAT